MSKIVTLASFLRFTSGNKLDLDELSILKITFKNSLELVWGMSHSISHRISSRISHKISHSNSHKIFLQDFPVRISCKISHKIFPQEFPAKISHKNFLQDFPKRISQKNFPNWILIGWLPITGQEQLIQSHLSARFCFDLSRNLN